MLNLHKVYQMEPAELDTNSSSAHAPRLSTSPPVWIVLLGGVLGGLIGFLFVNAAHPVFPFEELPELGMNPSSELVARYHAAEYAFRSNNAAIDCGVLGGCLGLLLGLVATKRRIPGAILTGVVAFIAGSVAGYAMGQFVAYAQITSSPQTLTQSAMIHATIWGVIGGAAAGVIGWLRGSSFLSMVVSGTAGGVLGAILFNAFAPLVSPISNLSIITPRTSLERIVWIAPAVVAIGLFVGLGLRESKSQKLIDAVQP